MKNETNSSLRIEHERLKANLEGFCHARALILRWNSEPVISNLLGKFKKDAEDLKESLVSVSKADVEKTQAGILARRSLCGYLENAYSVDIDEAERALKEFMERNALFFAADERNEGETGLKAIN